jgi:UDP-glucose 4-epimerase
MTTMGAAAAVDEQGLVLVTGGAGFIGSHVVDRLLAFGRGVVVLDDFSTGHSANLEQWAGDPRVTVVEADVADGLFAPLAAVTAERGAIARIIHLAAQTAVPQSMFQPLADVRVNCAGTVQVLEYARCCGVRKVVFSSSSAVYGDDVALPTDENEPTLPMSPYGIDKLAGEHFLRFYRAVHGLPFTAFRLFNVYGPRQDPASPYSGVISLFARQAVAGEPLTIFGDGNQTRDFVYVGDVAAAVAGACLSDAADGEVINLGTGIETTITKLARSIVARIGSASAIHYAAARPGDACRSVADIGRARQLLSFAPTVELAEGLAQTLDWMAGGGGVR